MKFHIPKQHKPTKERIDVKLETALVARLDRYCQYMESDRDYVIGTVLHVVFKKDKGFTEWLRQQESPSPITRDADRFNLR
jgi:bacterioferritin (cytochrome b1)